MFGVLARLLLRQKMTEDFENLIKISTAFLHAHAVAISKPALSFRVLQLYFLSVYLQKTKNVYKCVLRKMGLEDLVSVRISHEFIS